MRHLFGVGKPRRLQGAKATALASGVAALVYLCHAIGDPQVVHGRIFRTVDDLRVAVAAFVERYNAHWRVEKLGFLSPTEARLRQALPAAA